MKTSLRALALIATLCLVPRLSALTVVQSSSASSVMYGSGAMIVQNSSNLTFQPFDPTLGRLTGVTLVGSYHVVADVFDINQYPIPMDSLIGAETRSFIRVPGLYNDASLASQAAGGLQVLQPHEMRNFEATFDQMLSHTFSSPAELAYFAALGPKAIEMSSTTMGYTVWGGSMMTANHTATLTYIYDIPDGGSGSAFLAVGLLGTIAGHRRMMRGRSGAR